MLWTLRTLMSGSLSNRFNDPLRWTPDSPLPAMLKRSPAFRWQFRKHGRKWEGRFFPLLGLLDAKVPFGFRFQGTATEGTMTAAVKVSSPARSRPSPSETGRKNGRSLRAVTSFARAENRASHARNADRAKLGLNPATASYPGSALPFLPSPR